MIAKAKSISHGINCLNYITGESKNKKSPEKISHICDNLLPSGMDPTAIWNSMKMTSRSHPRVINNIVRIELSPAKENTANFTQEDWKNLWLDFVREFDHQELKDKNGKILSPKTNINGSKYTVWLHQDSKSGIPHLHAAICRVDDEGHINNDSNIHLRAQRAAEKVAIKYGWKTAGEIRNKRNGIVEKDCLDVLKHMKSWSFDEYFQRLENKGYNIQIRRSDDGSKVYGYTLQKDGSRYKASEIGKGRHFTASKIEWTWRNEHPEPKFKLSDNKGNNSFVITDDKGRQFEIPDYSKRRNNSRRVEISQNKETFVRFIPEPVMQFFENEFDYREYSNWNDCINESCYFFSVAQGILAMMNTPYYSSSGGGGTSDNELPRRRDDLEEEMKWAIRCAQAARSKITPVKKSGMRR
ncbi:MAG: relaxase [Muribaculaceae bacterium]|nr:relaxase [Muribaculaceae bacterium]